VHQPRVGGSNSAAPAVESVIYGSLFLEEKLYATSGEAQSGGHTAGEGDNPINVAARRKRIVWDVLNPADDAGGKSVAAKLLRRSSGTKTVGVPYSSVSEAELIINRWFTWRLLPLCLKSF
jgi:hypothetical protein